MVNWLKKLNQAKPFPVPFKTRDKIPFRGKETQDFGAWNIDQSMNEEEANKEEMMHPDMSYLGQGNVGMAYQTPESVIKYTSDLSECEAAERLYQNPIPCAVRVLSSPVILNDHLAKLELEKVTPLNLQQKEVISAAYDCYDQERTSDCLDQLDSHYDQKLILDYRILRECLWSNGFDPIDAHHDNVGYNSKGELVLLDLGGSV